MRNREHSALNASALQVTTNVTQAAWTDALQALPSPHFLQTWEWGALKEQYGWHVQRFLYERDSRIVAACTLLTRRLPLVPWSIGYVPKGPLLDYADTPLLDYADTPLLDYADTPLLHEVLDQHH